MELHMLMVAAVREEKYHHDEDETDKFDLILG